MLMYKFERDPRLLEVTRIIHEERSSEVCVYHESMKTFGAELLCASESSAELLARDLRKKMGDGEQVFYI